MEYNNLNIQEQSQLSFNNMDGQRNYQQNNNQQNNHQQNKSSSEPANPFIFSGTPSHNEDSDQPLENVKQVGTVTEIEPVKDICFISIIGEIEGHTS